MTRAAMAPAPGDPILPDQQTRLIQREGRSLGDAMFAAAGDPVRMREALQMALDKCGGPSFGPACTIALQHLSGIVGAMYPGAAAPTSHYEGTPR